jgi:hypothetical protein
MRLLTNSTPTIGPVIPARYKYLTWGAKDSSTTSETASLAQEECFVGGPAGTQNYSMSSWMSMETQQNRKSSTFFIQFMSMKSTSVPALAMKEMQPELWFSLEEQRL